jgi:hypothetical protein
MSHQSDPDLLVLHVVRTLGYADTARITARVGLTEDEVYEHLLDAQAQGWVAWSTYAGDGGWSPTQTGKTHGELLLAVELEATSARAAVEATHYDFLPVNDLVAHACTQWQLTEMGISDEPVSLEHTITTLQDAANALESLEARLTRHLKRFDGYHSRFTAALSQATTDPGWITGTDRDSAHRVWFELHEDLIATLGLTR